MDLLTCSRLINSDDIQVGRRQFLKAGLGTALAMGLPAFFTWKVLWAEERPVKEFRLTASLDKINLGTSPEFVAWTYNGQVPGPEIRVKEGEVIRVILKNNLPEATTIHWHGLPVPHAMDGVPGVTQEAVKPGKSFVYEFEARPAGSYIYHSHVKYQLDQGLYGALIVEPSDSLDTYDTEYTLVLEDWVMRDGGGVANTTRRPPMGMMHGRMHGMMHGRMGRNRRYSNEEDPLLEPIYDAYAVNGQVYPNMEPLFVKRGERVKLRLLNASSATIYDLRLAGHSLNITHVDGQAIKPVEKDVLRIGMGESYDVEFEANNPGQWLLAAVDRGFGEGMLRIPLQYKGVKRAEPVPPLFHRGLRFHSYWDFQALHPIEDPVRQRANRLYSQDLSGGMHSPFWTINGWVYPNAERLSVQEGELIRIRYSNHSMMPHPMHLHGHFFRVVNPSLPDHLWIQKDTIIVNHMERVEIEFLANNPGKWFHHCHNLYHMEAGMANVVVYQM